VTFLSEKLARSQMVDGAVMGIGMTMLEETVFDRRHPSYRYCDLRRLPDAFVMRLGTFGTRRKDDVRLSLYALWTSPTVWLDTSLWRVRRRPCTT
jgi:hypothetical protein